MRSRCGIKGLDNEKQSKDGLRPFLFQAGRQQRIKAAIQGPRGNRLPKGSIMITSRAVDGYFHRQRRSTARMQHLRYFIYNSTAQMYAHII